MQAAAKKRRVGAEGEAVPVPADAGKDDDMEGVEQEQQRKTPAGSAPTVNANPTTEAEQKASAAKKKIADRAMADVRGKGVPLVLDAGVAGGRPGWGG